MTPVRNYTVHGYRVQYKDIKDMKKIKEPKERKWVGVTILLLKIGK